MFANVLRQLNSSKTDERQLSSLGIKKVTKIPRMPHMIRHLVARGNCSRAHNVGIFDFCCHQQKKDLMTNVDPNDALNFQSWQTISFVFIMDNNDTRKQNTIVPSLQRAPATMRISGRTARVTCQMTLATEQRDVGQLKEKTTTECGVKRQKVNCQYVAQRPAQI
jgi:hypothetical protein